MSHTARCHLALIIIMAHRFYRIVQLGVVHALTLTLCQLSIQAQAQSNEAQTSATSDAAAKLLERSKTEKSDAWIDDGKLTFVHQTKADSVQVKVSTQSKPMKKIAGSDVWTCQITLPDVERGILTYGFDAILDGRPVAGGGRKRWRGPKAPPPLVSSESILGTLEHHDLESNSLGETRKISVYLPSTNHKAEWVVYMSDGDAVTGYSRIIDPLIESGDLPPIAIVGTHSGVYQGEIELKRDDVRRNVRALEYVPSLDPNRFAQHERFFVGEVLKWSEEKYSLPSSAKSRIVFGFSNGGSFSATMGIRHPDVFGYVIACAVAGDPYDLSKRPKPTNEFFLVSGKWDTRFHGNVQYLHKALTKAKVKSRIVVRAAEHDGTMWQEEFVSALKVIAERK